MNKLLKYISLNVVIALLSIYGLNAQKYVRNLLNPEIAYGGDYLLYKGEEIKLGTKTFYIDGQLSNEEVKDNPYVFNSVNEAVKHLTNGTESEPMTLFIAPWVYWIDNPDDPSIRLPKVPGGTPFGLEIECNWLKFYGLADNPRDVVLASNRGQTMGAKGNFTMFLITGDGTRAENITFGNYCNIDLEYPLHPKLNRSKRGSAIVQAQLMFTFGDKLFARNTHFVSRLNLCPFWGGKRTLFDHCHFESTDDALAPTGLYLNSTFDIYSSKPFGHTAGTGAILLNCKIRSFTLGEQYWVKGRGQVAAIDCEIVTSTATYWGWRDNPELESRNYDYNNRFNGIHVLTGSHHPYATVEMTGKSLLDAYRFEYEDEVVYNIYNLLKGEDDWDPLELKKTVKSAEKRHSKSYTNIPTQLLVSSTRDSIETGKDTLLLKATVKLFDNSVIQHQKVNWTIAPEYNSMVNLNILSDGSCVVIPTNNSDELKTVIINASTSSGLEGASVIYVLSTLLEPPSFDSLPTLKIKQDGRIKVNYTLNMRFNDQSLVTWYRCSDAAGSDPIEVAVSRFNEPYLSYTLSSGDIGWFIMAKVEPKHIRCLPGEAKIAISKKRIESTEVKTNSRTLNVNLRNMSTKYQPEIKQGFFTLDCFAPIDTKEHDWVATNNSDPWYYGGNFGKIATDTGLIQANKGARLRYTPVGDTFSDMKISFTAIPAKTAGQGFSSARQQYMDIFIKFDGERLNGYALRLIRTTKYSDAIDFILMVYENGIATPISNPISADCYRPNCHFVMEIKGNKFSVHAENSLPYHIVPNRSEVKQVVNIETEIAPNDWGGFGFQHTGTVGSGSTLIKDLKVEWI